MEALIPVINQLQDVLNAVGSDEIDLPQIVVVGSQSSGKSSVLEALVGRDFLPRGSGIVTRRPLVLQLNNIPATGESSSKGDVNQGEWGEFSHMPRKTFFNFNEIREEIQKDTDRVAGKNKGVMADAITLKIFSPHVLNLTLVDLPGITKVPVGDQPSNIEEQIRDMVLKYITKPSAIILAVTAANTDLANSDALQMARRVDPQGDRTIGVLTKLDLMDKGTNALEVLQGKLLPLKLGYIAVVNRSQQDIITGKPMADAIKQETEFFANHPLYKTLQGQCGAKFLGSSLNRTLMHHIKTKLPELRLKVNQSLDDALKELQSFGSIPEGANKQAMILDLINKFSCGYKDVITGKVSKDNDLSTKMATELAGGARINYVFNEVFAPELQRIDPMEGLSYREIRYALRNATGPRNALFVPESAFELLVKRQIARLEFPAVQCVDHIFSELQRMIAGLESPELARFERLRERVMTVADQYLSKCRIPCKQMIGDLLAIESAYINTSHPDFTKAIQELRERREAGSQSATAAGSASPSASSNGVGNPFAPVPSTSASTSASSSSQGNLSASAATPTKRGASGSSGAASASTSLAASSAASTSHKHSSSKPVALTMSQLMATATFGEGELSDREKQEIIMVQFLLRAYFNIVRVNIQDTVPKAIMHLLVNESTKMDRELTLQLIGQGDGSDLLLESDEAAARRKACEQNVDMLQKAKAILATVRDTVS